ncbi:TauD/TfdA family dioxygenase [Pelagibius sp. Alg239-R121]|uniref:TauD/TfdA family dioxygenase n=1 Tax=Pelagibius sp. Alg239-R121 TaxID=2993448 RepID=UPI0024A6E383|nr:TauD/TfdA family dioxygenase [Pelagibius sp. Alg239-R121]
MLKLDQITPAIGVEISGVDFSRPLTPEVQDEFYQALLDHLVIFVRGTAISPETHLAFARSFGDLDRPHPLYPHVESFENIVLLENDSNTPPDTNSWHTDLTFKAEQPFASILVARHVPPTGGDTMWSSCYAAYDRLPDGMKRDLKELEAVHDMGDFRNSFAEEKDGKSGVERLDDGFARFGQNLRPLIGRHPVTGRIFLNFNEAFVSHIAGLTTNESNALKSFLANHMNKPEDQMRWRWSEGDLAMWDNRVTMHYAVADYLPRYRCMNRITVIQDRRVKDAQTAA